MILTAIQQYAYQCIGKNVTIKYSTRHKKLLKEKIFFGHLNKIKEEKGVITLNVTIAFEIQIISKKALTINIHRANIIIRERVEDIAEFTFIKEGFDIIDISRYLKNYANDYVKTKD